jgi:glyoxylase-like metal-dependent hydrolase (beta-lactamase superfamily II)
MSDAVALPAGVTVLERGWLSSNNVVFATGTTAVVDTGYATHSQQTLALVRQALHDAPLDRIVNTHLHSDHCGGNAALQAAFPDAQTLIPPGQADAVARWDEDVLTYATTGQHCPRFRFESLLQPGTSVRLGRSDWEIHAAPGHDPHSVVLFDRASRTLVSADALWANGFGIVFPELDGERAFDEVAATLDLIESLQPLAVIPGHGPPFAGDVHVKEALARARSRLESFVASPRRHASHAIKVLVKFKLLELQSIGFDDFMAWASGMPYLRRVHARFFVEQPVNDWLEQLTAELVKSKALGRDGANLYNM